VNARQRAGGRRVVGEMRSIGLATTLAVLLCAVARAAARQALHSFTGSLHEHSGYSDGWPGSRPAVSHSPIWKDSAIFVTEDDSQDGADHVDAHRMPAFVISPWARHAAVVHHRYDQLSMLRTIELILGLKPLSLFDANAVPMYDAFTDHPETTAYDAVTPQQSLTDVNAKTAPGLAGQLPFDRVDAVPQELFDRVLWHSVYGPDSAPPAPGPDASPAERGRATGAIAAYRSGRSVRAFLLHGAQADSDG
jgi:Phosphoesterase family